MEKGWQRGRGGSGIPMTITQQNVCIGGADKQVDLSVYLPDHDWLIEHGTAVIGADWDRSMSISLRVSTYTRLSSPWPASWTPISYTQKTNTGEPASPQATPL